MVLYQKSYDHALMSYLLPHKAQPENPTPCGKRTRNIGFLRSLLPVCFLTILWSVLFLKGAWGITVNEIVESAIINRTKIYADLENFSYTAYAKEVSSGQWKGKSPGIIRMMEYWVNGMWKKPNNFHEEISAYRVRGKSGVYWDIGILNDSVGDRIDIGYCTVVNPLAKDALQHYNYTLKGTVTIEELEVYEIAVEPVNQNSPALEGTIWIDTQSFLSVGFDVTFNKATTLPMFINHLRVFEQKARFLKKYWLPNIQRQEVEFSIWKLFKGIGKKEILFNNININSDSLKTISFKERLSFAPYSGKKDSVFWANNSLLPNTAYEDSSFRLLPEGNLYPVLLSTNPEDLETAYQKAAREYMFSKGKQTFMFPSSFNDFLRYNRIDGVRLGIGFTNVISKNFDIFWRTGYGFADTRWKYEIGGKVKPLKNDKINFGMSFYRELGFKEDQDVVNTGWNTVTSLFVKSDRRDYYLSNGWKLFSGWSINNATTAQVTYLNEKESSVGSATDFGFIGKNYHFRHNPAIIPGNMRSIQMDFRYNTPNRFSVHSDGWDIKSHGEISDAKILKSDFSFSLLGVNITRHQRLTARSMGLLTLEAQTSLHGLPPQRLFEFGGTVLMYPVGKLRGTSFKEFGGDKYVKLTAEYRDGGALLQRSKIPIPYKQLLQLIVFMGGAYSDISYQTKLKLPGPVPAILNNPYLEGGLALADVYHIVRVDFMWRNHTHMPGYFLIRIHTLK
ncbi:MAG: DUF5686 family protein [Patescibacteria group bacterium]|nr:DUF5686 family protein [Patescibacteria group bacterium]